MRYVHFIYIMIAALLSACSNEDTLSDKPHGDIIQLSAGVTAITEVTRAEAEPYTLTTPTSANPLEADIWLSTTSGQYPGNTATYPLGVNAENTVIDAHRTIKYISAYPTTPSADSEGKYLRYNANTGIWVYCIGMYPQGVWSTTDGSSVTATFDGKQDLMFAKEISGNVADPLSNRQQTFLHMLTWIKVRVRAEDLVTGDTWGKLKKISIKSKNSLTVTNLTTAATSVGYVRVSGDPMDATETDIVLFDDSDPGVDSYALNTTSVEKGSAFVAPVEADGGYGTEYTLHVVCENLEKDIPVNLTTTDGSTAFSGPTAGKVFVITLYFKTLDYIEGTVTLVPWEDEYQDLILQE